MAICSNCGQKVSFLDTRKDLCQSCFVEEQIKKLGESPAHCKMTIGNVIWQPAALNLAVGDLFLTNNSIVQIRYARCAYSGNMGKGAGFLAGGLGGAFAMHFMDNDVLIGAQREADGVRAQDYAMTIEDRLRKRNGLVIPRTEISSIDTDLDPGQKMKGMMRINYKGGQLELAIFKLADYQKKLKDWLHGSLEDQEDANGINMCLPAADQFIAALETGKGLPQALLIEQMSKNEKYLAALWGSFDRLTKEKQSEFINALLKLPGKWQETAQKHVHSKYAEARIGRNIFLVGALIGIVSCGCLLTNWSVFSRSIIWLSITLIFSLCLVATIPGSIALYFDAKQYNDILVHLTKEKNRATRK